MSKTKQIPCKVCGKLFTPCGWCQDNGSTFRWRNFACSLECAKIYVAKAEKYNAQQVEAQTNKTKSVRKKQKKSETAKPVDNVAENTAAVESTNNSKPAGTAETAPSENAAPIEDTAEVQADQNADVQAV